MTEYHAGRLTELSESGRRVLKCGDIEIGVFVIDGEVHAWHSECAHRGGPVCQGRLMKRVIEPLQADKTIRTAQYQETETHIVCPWHGYEYNIKTGEHPGHAGLKLRRAAVTVRNGDVYVILG
jgi:nitrite reductase/ring-hydroxylating ferredoxin subunit